MTSMTKTSLTLLIAGAGWLGMITACGGDSSGGGDNTGGASSGGTGGSIVGGAGGMGGSVGGAGGSGGGSGGTGGGSGGTGGAKPDGNDTKETATQTKIGKDPQTDAVQGALDPADKDQDWYKFDGKKGQILSILTDAKPSAPAGDPFDPTYVDLVITMYDSAGKQIAEQDDPNPRTSNDPFLMTVLPADGTYYVRVVECTAWEKGGASNCAPVAKITKKNYVLYISEMTFADVGEVKETEPNDTDAQASLVTHKATTTAGSYFLTTMHGTFSGATDIDVWTFKVPADVTVDAGARLNGSLYTQEGGISGNGSTTSPGEVWIAAKSAPTVILAQVDASKGQSIDVPLTAGTDYLAFYKRVASPTGGNDFYFDLSGFGGGNPVEKQETANDVLATAEVLTIATTATSYFVEGDLISTSDVDHFSMVVPTQGADTVSVACGAQRSGSGLRNFTMNLLKGDGSAISGGTIVEAADKDAVLENLTTPAGQSKLILKLNATSQDANIKGTYYRCGIHFRPKA